MTMAQLDPRVTAFRADLAAAHLEGMVEAARFVEGRATISVAAVAALRAKPDAQASRETELLFGEGFTVYEEKNGWAWGQSSHDSYVGYVRADALSVPTASPTHRVASLGTPLLPAPDVKRAALALLPMNAKLRVVGEEGRYSRVEGGHFVYAANTASVNAAETDWVSVAERFLGVPYLWGGKTYFGCDCSGLIQTALEQGGIAAPRDTDMMEAALGTAMAPEEALSQVRRGDLVFWKGHIGVMTDAENLLHANAFHMQVAMEPLRDAVARIAATGSALRVIKRLKA